MTIKFNVPGSKRKELAKTIATWLGTEAAYAGAPSFAYHISDHVLERDGKLITCGLNDETCERLLQHLYDEGFEAEGLPESEPATATEPGIKDSLKIKLDGITEAQQHNISAMIASKKNLIIKALGYDDLYIATTDDELEFPWFKNCETEEDRKAVEHLIRAICEKGKEQTRVTAKEKEVENDKYAFRCFLLRLGFIGPDFKQERKALLRNLTGSSAFRSAKESEVEE